MLKAKQIVENKFWILENETGIRVGTVAVRGDKVTATIENKPVETFDSFDQLIGKHDVAFVKRIRDHKIKEVENQVYDFPTNTEPFNALWNVQLKIPMYTKTDKSNSYHCAGYYIVGFGTGWVKSFCPKLITLQRYGYKGPFKTKVEMQEQLRLANESA
jgi:hypothetical protein